MRTRMALSVVTFLLGVSIASGQESDLSWKRYGNEAGRFSIMLPGPPKQQTQQTDSPLGKLTVHSLTVEPTAKLAFLVSWNDYPPAVANEDAQSVLSRVRDGNNQFLKGTVVLDQKTEVGKEKHPGRTLEIEFTYLEETMIYRANAILVGGTRLYQVVMIGPRDVVRSETADDYFRSLKLLPKKD